MSKLSKYAPHLWKDDVSRISNYLCISSASGIFWLFRKLLSYFLQFIFTKWKNPSPRWRNRNLFAIVPISPRHYLDRSLKMDIWTGGGGSCRLIFINIYELLFTVLIMSLLFYSKSQIDSVLNIRSRPCQHSISILIRLWKTTATFVPVICFFMLFAFLYLLNHNFSIFRVLAILPWSLLCSSV